MLETRARERRGRRLRAPRRLARRGRARRRSDRAAPTPRLVCIAAEIRIFRAEKLAEGLALVTSSWRRPAPDVLDPRVKSLNYLNNALAKQEAQAARRRRGADAERGGRGRRGQRCERVRVRGGGSRRRRPATARSRASRARSCSSSPRSSASTPPRRTLGRFDLLGARRGLPDRAAARSRAGARSTARGSGAAARARSRQADSPPSSAHARTMPEKRHRLSTSSVPLAGRARSARCCSIDSRDDGAASRKARVVRAPAASK